MAYDSALREPHGREFDITGKPMNDRVLVKPGDVEEDNPLSGWIQRALEFGATSPKK